MMSALPLQSLTRFLACLSVALLALAPILPCKMAKADTGLRAEFVSFDSGGGACCHRPDQADPACPNHSDGQRPSLGCCCADSGTGVIPSKLDTPDLLAVQTPVVTQLGNLQVLSNPSIEVAHLERPLRILYSVWRC